jgi:ATP-dependent DNA helicase RecG
MVSWDSPLSAIAGKDSGKHVAGIEKSAGLRTVGDLLGYYPRAYVAKGSLSELGELVEGDMLSLVGEVKRTASYTYKDRRTNRTAYRLEIVVHAEGGDLTLTYFDKNQHTAQWRREHQLAVGRTGMFSGRLKLFRNVWQLTNPDSRMWDEDAGHVQSAMPDLIPIYPEAGKVSTWHLEETVAFALAVIDRVPDILPESIRAEHDLISAGLAYQWIHRPDDRSQLGAARKRLKFDEAFLTQAVLARRREQLRGVAATGRAGRAGCLLDAFDSRLPFELTAGQRAVGEEIAADLGAPHQMHRLLQGEVGSGKTLVALRAMLQVVDSGAQAALLAPTEVLAQQHYRSITAMLGDLGEGGTIHAADHATRVALLTGSMGTAARRRAMAEAASGEAGIVIGTHALLEEKVQFAELGLVVGDEQHRFGVEQRAALADKSATPPHVLVMTATPIPRTIAMTVFGDLDTSTLKELPAGRAEVQTNVVPTRVQPAWLDRAWERIREEVALGRQAYVVCARIGDRADDGSVDVADDEELGIGAPALKAVVELAPELDEGALAGLRVAGLHGRMSPDDKDATMRAFAAGEIDVLVSTTVIEVGVDVRNASVMVIMDADRFGVSQLHQLRGRIGRGGLPGLCLLVSDADPDSSSMERLRAVASTRDGFELSRIDLEQRREGDVLGARQSGSRRTLKLLSVLHDERVIEDARACAGVLVAAEPDLLSYPDLEAAVSRLESSAAADFMDKA